MSTVAKEQKIRKDLNKRYSIKDIPGWVIKKNCRAKFADAACFVAIDEGHALFTKETEKALLFEWTNDLGSCHVSGGEFWVAKSILGSE